ncbi:MAG: potassium channel family protein [Terriglobales bacterium]
MLDLHIVEILIWAFALNAMGLIVHTYDAIYFCANGYTTLGMGKVDVGEHWRLISPIIGMSGLFTFAWTTSALVDVVASNRRLLEQLEDEREQEMHMRFALRKKQWDDLKAARDAERAAREKIKTAAAGSSLRQRFRMWREERKEVAEIRRENKAEMEDLRRQERLKEKEAEAKPMASNPPDKKQG